MIGPALEELDLTAALAAYREQSETHGHTAESDADRKVQCFGEELVRRSFELRDVLIPGDRQNLAAAYRRATKLVAFGLATARRIRLEQQIKGQVHELGR